MLPFSSIDFFWLFLLFFGIVLICRAWFRSFIPYRRLLLFITLFYIIGYFTEPLKAFGFVAYCYLIYFLFDYIFKLKNKLTGSILLALPMIFVKAHWQTDIVSFAGLSYITFRVIQIYLDNDRSSKPVSVPDFFLFMLFPATLLIGPIDRFDRFRSDLDSGYSRINPENLTRGWELLLLGILQKYIMAEAVNRFWLSHADQDSKHVSEMANNMYAYSLYLYFDFAGYSALASGMGRMFGINVPENFNNPFFAVNPQDFWRRWHITLGNWLRDYIFRPYYKWISGIRSLKNYPLLKQNTGLFLTFLVMGLWNGFLANYIISGSIFGIYSVVHNTYLVQCRKKQRDVIFGKMGPIAVKCISIFLMFNLTCFALYIFSGRCHF